jgi:hypothetical protein
MRLTNAKKKKKERQTDKQTDRHWQEVVKFNQRIFFFASAKINSTDGIFFLDPTVKCSFVTKDRIRESDRKTDRQT